MNRFEDGTYLKFILRRCRIISMVMTQRFQKPIIKCIIKAVKYLTAYKFSIFGLRNRQGLLPLKWKFEIFYETQPKKNTTVSDIYLICTPTFLHNYEISQKKLIFNIKINTIIKMHSIFFDPREHVDYDNSYRLSTGIKKYINSHYFTYESIMRLSMFPGSVQYETKGNGYKYIKNILPPNPLYIPELIFEYCISRSKSTECYKPQKSFQYLINQFETNFLNSNFLRVNEIQKVKFRAQFLLNSLMYKISFDDIKDLKFKDDYRLMFISRRKKRKLKVLVDRYREYKEKMQRRYINDRKRKDRNK